MCTVATNSECVCTCRKVKDLSYLVQRRRSINSDTRVKKKQMGKGEKERERKKKDRDTQLVMLSTKSISQ